MINAFVITWAVVGWAVMIFWLIEGLYDKITKPWKRVLFLFLCGPCAWVGVFYLFITYLFRVTKLNVHTVRFFTNGQEKT